MQKNVELLQDRTVQPYSGYDVGGLMWDGLGAKSIQTEDSCSILSWHYADAFLECKFSSLSLVKEFRRFLSKMELAKTAAKIG